MAVFFRNGSRKWRRRGRKVETDSGERSGGGLGRKHVVAAEW
jgi:hypothetical protein